MNGKRGMAVWVVVFAGCMFAFSGSVFATACSISVTDLPFMSYNPSQGVDQTAVGEVTLTCNDDGSTNTVNYSLSLNGGQTGLPSDRRMLGMGPDQIQYNVYVDASHSVVWGDGSGGSVTVDGNITPPSGGSTSNSHLAHGRIPGGQTQVSPGSYSDSLILEITF